MLRFDMRFLVNAMLVTTALVLAACAGNNDNRHTTATTVVPPPRQQVLRVEIRPSPKIPARPDDPRLTVDPSRPLLIFNLPDGKTFREGEAVTIDFSLANAKLKGDGGEYRVRYFVDDGEMQWVDHWEQLVLTGWVPGEHTIRVELVGPDGWPYRNGDYNVVTRKLTVIE